MLSYVKFNWIFHNDSSNGDMWTIIDLKIVGDFDIHTWFCKKTCFYIKIGLYDD